MVGGTIGELWRYPVKSMQGERIELSDVTERGLVGDRAYAVVDADSGKVASAKHPRLWGDLLQCRARYVSPPAAGAAPSEVVVTLPDGTETSSGDPAVDRRLSTLLGRPVRLTTVAPEGNAYLAVWPDGVMPDEFLAQVVIDGDEPEGSLTELRTALAAPPGTFFDVAALHVVARATLRRLGELQPSSSFDVLRYRPNIVLDGPAAPFAENSWGQAALRLGGGGMRASVLFPTMRCIMTTLAQRHLPRDNGILRAVTRHNRVDIEGLGTWSCVGAYATVTAPGQVKAGDTWNLATAG